jgi:hypothetical protein
MIPATINKLTALGFIHITGCTTVNTGRPITAPLLNWGQWVVSGPLKFVVLQTGEIFISRGKATSETTEAKDVLSEFCPKGQANFGLLTGDETLDWTHVLSRMKDPEWCGDDGKSCPADPARAEWAYREWLTASHAKELELARVTLVP